VARAEFRYEQMVPARSNAEAVAILRNWAEATRSKVKGERHWDYFQVEHGRKSMADGWQADAPKLIDFHLAETPSGVYIRAVVSLGFPYAGEAREKQAEAYANFGALLAGVWRMFNPMLGENLPPLAVRVRPQRELTASQSGLAAASVAAGIILLAIGFLVALFVGHIVALVLIVPGHFLAMFGWKAIKGK
jgi:hypothetical protein